MPVLNNSNDGAVSGGGGIPPESLSGITAITTEGVVSWLTHSQIPDNDFWIEGWVEDSANIQHIVPLQKIIHAGLLAGSHSSVVVGRNDGLTIVATRSAVDTLVYLSVHGQDIAGDFHWTIRAT